MALLFVNTGMDFLVLGVLWVVGGPWCRQFVKVDGGVFLLCVSLVLVGPLIFFVYLFVYL